MTADELRKKDRNEMKKENTHPVKVCRFVVTSHAQNRMVGRGIRNETMIENLCRKPAAKSKVRFSSKGPSYLRMNRDTTTAINPVNKNVTTIRRTKRNEAHKYGFERSDHLVLEWEMPSERVPSGRNRVASKKKQGR